MILNLIYVIYCLSTVAFKPWHCFSDITISWLSWHCFVEVIVKWLFFPFVHTQAAQAVLGHHTSSFFPSFPRSIFHTHTRTPPPPYTHTVHCFPGRLLYVWPSVRGYQVSQPILEFIFGFVGLNHHLSFLFYCEPGVQDKCCRRGSKADSSLAEFVRETVLREMIRNLNPVIQCMCICLH